MDPGTLCALKYMESVWLVGIVSGNKVRSAKGWKVMSEWGQHWWPRCAEGWLFNVSLLVACLFICESVCGLSQRCLQGAHRHFMMVIPQTRDPVPVTRCYPEFSDVIREHWEESNDLVMLRFEPNLKSKSGHKNILSLSPVSSLLQYGSAMLLAGLRHFWTQI